MPITGPAAASLSFAGTGCTFSLFVIMNFPFYLQHSQQTGRYHRLHTYGAWLQQPACIKRNAVEAPRREVWNS